MQKNTILTKKLADLSSGKVSVAQNAKDFLAQIEKNNKKLNIVLELNPKIDERIKFLEKKQKNKENLGHLFGICVFLKSNINYKGLKTSCASNTLADYTATYHADIVERLEKEDAVILGIVNNDEFASGSSGETSAFGPTANPMAIDRVPGGSSSGSAGAVAAGFCDIAIGTDTGGSVRNPASHCGIVGIKPSYGRVSRYGIVDLAMSFDQAGPLAADVKSAALALEVLSGHSSRDPTTYDKPVPAYSAIEAPKKMTFGIIKSFKGMIADKHILAMYEDTIRELKAAGHEVKEIDMNYMDLAIEAYYPIVYAEFFSGTRKFDGLKYGKKIEEAAGDEALRRVLGGREISRSEFEGAYYKKALKVRELIAAEFAKAFTKVDVILSPVTPSLPHKIGDEMDPEHMYAYDAFTTPANLAGICAGVVPKVILSIGDETLPIGIQCFADAFNEEKLIGAMLAIEELNK